MGCDIHMVTEQRVGDTWVGLAMSDVYPMSALDPDPTNRNYRFFAALAGVRGEGPEPKGIPEDVSPLAQLAIEGWGVDGHSHSYMSIKEFVHTWINTNPEVMANVTKERLRGDTYRTLYDNAFYNLSMNTCWGYKSDKADNIRVVFWFDN